MSNIKKVAKRANVSTATVSRVLAGNYPVASDTKRKVLEAVKELNYQPNGLARDLRKMETKTVIVLVPDIGNPFFSEIIRGMEDVALKEGFHILLGNTNNSMERELEYINLINERRADGLIFATARIEKDYILQLSEQKPLVLACEYLEGIDIPSVSIDNISGARKAVNHLIELGHLRIAHISGPMNVVLSKDRLNGYMQALHFHELELDQSMIQEGDFTIESGFVKTKKLLSLLEPPSAIFASNDEMAIGAIKAIKEAGKSIPEDIAVVGFDNIRMSEVIEPNLTTISQPRYLIGETAMEMLLSLIRGIPLARPQVVLPDNLIIRDSCGAGLKK